ERLHPIRFDLARGGRIDRLGERQLEAIVSGPHFVDLERHLAGPHQALNGKGLVAARAPAAVGAADEERAVLAEAHRHTARAEALAEGKARPLIPAVDLLQENAHDRAVRLVADEQLSLERPELAAAPVAVDAAGRLAHLAVREQHGRRDKLRDALRL